MAGIDPSFHHLTAQPNAAQSVLQVPDPREEEDLVVPAGLRREELAQPVRGRVVLEPVLRRQLAHQLPLGAA